MAEDVNFTTATDADAAAIVGPDTWLETAREDR